MCDIFVFYIYIVHCRQWQKLTCSIYRYTFIRILQVVYFKPWSIHRSHCFIFSVVVCLRCLLHHILSLIVYTFRENQEFVFISIVQFMMNANNRIRFGLQIVFVCVYITPSSYHYCAYFIWRHWTYKMPVRYGLSSVWVRLSIWSQLSIIQFVGLCVFSLPISFVMIEIIYIPCLIIIIKSEVWTITHCLGLGHETMVCAVCISILLCNRCACLFYISLVSYFAFALFDIVEDCLSHVEAK